MVIYLRRLLTLIRLRQLQREVWRALVETNFGETMTYATLANQIGRPTAVRAVASAVGKNPLLVFAGCHRIVRSDGTLGQYRRHLTIFYSKKGMTFVSLAEDPVADYQAWFGEMTVKPSQERHYGSAVSDYLAGRRVDFTPDWQGRGTRQMRMSVCLIAGSAWLTWTTNMMVYWLS
ncbi:methylated-DNA--[protein]-cysteine S-methyltransferase [Weissella confusa]|uniref:Methylated-DNA--[protein]-cysteine S-methyltransferase n=1 Tax=Weissella confusa TaxID=1583 RepID=A0A923NH65_WEICO|nr:methylated-DNA--[protein]-cysteine S-methyltransferase [Weissella confusa]